MELGGRFFRLGVPLALSLTGYLHLRSQSQIITPSPSSLSLSASKPSAASPTGGLKVKDELRILTREEDLAKIINGFGFGTTTTTTTTTTSTTNSRYDDDLLFPVSKHQLLLEDKRDPTTTTTPKLEVHEVEVRYLYLTEESLLERQRERALETQMVEYHESKAKELETRLKANTTEAHLSSLNREALQAENQRLRTLTLVSDYSKVITKLRSARARARKIKILLQKKRDDTEVDNKLKRLEELEETATDLMKVNSRLAQENSELKLELNSVEGIAKCLREENGKLLLDLEHLNSGRREEQVEELVYLKWVNACLRFELRHNQPPARDPSRILSPPESEQQQANSGFGERNIISPTDLESDSSTASNKDSMTKRNRSAKPKFISKLKRLVLGKDRHSKSGNPMRRGSVSPCPLEDVAGSGVSPHYSSSCTSVQLVPDDQQTGVGWVGDEQWQNRGVEPQSSSRSLDSLGPERLIYRSYRYPSMAMGDDNKIHLSLNSRPERIDFKDPLLS